MRHFLLAALFAAGAVVACGSDASPATATPDAGTTSAAEWAPGNHGGYLFLRYAGGKLGVAAFFHVLPSGGTCSTTTSGACVVKSCTVPPTDDGGADSTVSDPAGKITIAGGALPADYGVAYTDSGYPYVETPVAGGPWALGDAITFTATGEWVKPFTTTVSAPALGASVSAPAFTASPLAVDRARALPVAWSGASGGNIEVVVANADTTRAFGSATCTFDAAAGAGEIPAAVLGKMAPGAGSLLVHPSSSTTVTSGQYTFTVAIQSGATNGSGTLAFQ